jgi:hypothetical protein
MGMDDSQAHFRTVCQGYEKYINDLKNTTNNNKDFELDLDPQNQKISILKWL